MEKLIVHGGAELAGVVNISGSKNSALPILAATLLTGEKCVIRRVPDLSDIQLHAADPAEPAERRSSGPAEP